MPPKERKAWRDRATQLRHARHEAGKPGGEKPGARGIQHTGTSRKKIGRKTGAEKLKGAKEVRNGGTEVTTSEGSKPSRKRQRRKIVKVEPDEEKENSATCEEEQSVTLDGKVRRRRARRSNLPQSKTGVVEGDASNPRSESETERERMIQVRAGARTVLSEKKGGRPAGRPPDLHGGG
jgi:hypothetical protein